LTLPSGEPDTGHTMSEHMIMMAMLFVSIVIAACVGILTWRVNRRSDHLEGIIAATYLEARRALERHKL
jgi:uncharacterized membrane protein AbrB (regulator of aidB expression)